MTSLDDVYSEFDRLYKKRKTNNEKTLDSIDKLLSMLTDAKEEISNIGGIDGMVGEQSSKSQQNHTESSTEEISIVPPILKLKGRLKSLDMVSTLHSSHKDINNAYLKFGKILDSNFHNDPGKDISNLIGDEEMDVKIVDSVISAHFYREGRFEEGDIFVKESGLAMDVDCSQREPFVHLCHVIQALNQQNLQPAFNWCSDPSVVDKLKQKNSNLEFNICRMQFLNFISIGDTTKALEYSKLIFPRFAQSHMANIQKLMGCFLFAKNLNQSPYAEFLQPSQWDDLRSLFTHDYCYVMDLSATSPLFNALTCGFIALPTLLKLSSVLHTKRSNDLNDDSSPINPTLKAEVELGDDFAFHSIFACPVSREQTTAENPPMMLTCGHVISQVSLKKLEKGHSRMVKCPYCPTELPASDAKEIYF